MSRVSAKRATGPCRARPVLFPSRFLPGRGFIIGANIFFMFRLPACLLPARIRSATCSILFYVLRNTLIQ